MFKLLDKWRFGMGWETGELCSQTEGHDRGCILLKKEKVLKVRRREGKAGRLFLDLFLFSGETFEQEMR